ncbi:MFS transporter [uncultured Megasphaera sp.]|uniref:MFS transporter n=1 Tax=uncultured Megasphaera sp. TaxID=165188 RepID=UPI0026598942|nr:MFS transporter [uncultured Megasphaera sp.]
MWNRAVISVVILSFMLGMCEFIIIGIIPEIADSLSVSLTQAGMAISYFAVFYAVGTPVLSIWGSRFRRYYFLLTLTFLFAAGNIAAFFIDDYALFLADRMFLASLAGVLFAVLLAFAPYIAPRKYMASVVAWLNAGFSIAAVFGLPFGSLITKYIAWQYIFLGLGVLTALDFFLMASVLPKKVGEVRAVSVWRELTLLKDRRVQKGAIVVIGNAASIYCWYSYITPLLTDVMGLDAHWTSLILLAIGGGTIFSTIIGGRMAERGGFYILWPVVASQAVLTLLLTLFVYSPVGLVILLAMSMMFYIQCASAQVFFMRLSMMFYPGTTMMGSAVSPTAFNLGVALGTALGSLTVDMSSMAYTPIPGAVCMAVSAFFMWHVMGPERQRKKRLLHS